MREHVTCHAVQRRQLRSSVRQWALVEFAVYVLPVRTCAPSAECAARRAIKHRLGRLGQGQRFRSADAARHDGCTQQSFDSN